MNTFQMIAKQITDTSLNDVEALILLKQRIFNLQTSTGSLADKDWESLHLEVNQRLELTGAKVAGVAIKFEDHFYKLSRHPVPLAKVTRYPMSVYGDHFLSPSANKFEIISELESMAGTPISQDDIPLSWFNALERERNKRN